MHELELHVGEDNLIEWLSMQDAADDSYINDATVTATLKDPAGAAVTNASNISLSYVAGSNGDYQGVIPENAALVRRKEYFLEVTAVSAGRNGFRRIRCLADYHGAP